MWPIWGETICTQAMQSVDNMSIPQEREREREGGGSLGHLSAKSRPGKNYKIQYKWCYPSELISLCEPSIYDNSHCNVNVLFKSWIHIQKWHLSVWTPDNSNPRFGFAYSFEIHYTVILLMAWKAYIQFLQWILYKIIESQVGKGISLIFEMCAVIAWNRNFMSLSFTIWPMI